MKALNVHRTVSLGKGPGITGLNRTMSVHTPKLDSQVVKAVLKAMGTELRSVTEHDKATSLDSSTLQFRLYKYDSGALTRVQLPPSRLAQAVAKEHDTDWEMVNSPKIGAVDRDNYLANLLDLPHDTTTDPATPRTQQKHYSGVYFMHAVGAEASAKPAYSVEPRGEADTTEYRLQLQQAGNDVSAWHDVPLRNPDGTLNFVCEIPKDTSAKMEVATKEAGNPIKQDIKKGKLRFYPYPINWNYGMLPQTWEDPGKRSEELGGITGDNDPVDVVEVGARQLATGGVYRVKPLGAYAMIDEGELDWKVVCIAAEDPRAAGINDIEDLEREMPGELERIMVWFRDYKIPDGKPANAFGFDSQPQNAEFANKVIDETHELYQNLKQGTTGNAGNLALA